MNSTLTSFAAALAVTASGLVDHAEAAPVTLQNPTATSQQTFAGTAGVTTTIDGVSGPNNGMGFIDGFLERGNNLVVWETTADLSGNGLLSVDLVQDWGADLYFERFRISVTDADRSLFADGNPGAAANPGVDPTPATPYGDTGADSIWTILDPSVFTATNNVTLNKGGAGVLIATQDFDGTTGAKLAGPTSTYTVSGQSPLSNITGIRVEAMAGADGAVGFGINAVLNEIEVDFTPGGSAPASAYKGVELVRPSATVSMPDHEVEEAIDTIEFTGPAGDGGRNGWGIFHPDPAIDGRGQDNMAVFQTEESLDASELVFEINHNIELNGFEMRRFRLAYTTEPNPSVAANNTWTIIDPTEVSVSRLLSSATELVDKSIEIDKNTIPNVGKQGNSYQVIADFGQTVSGITGFRLESLESTTTPGAWSFTGDNNFVVSEFNVFASNGVAVIPEPASVLIWLVGGTFLVNKRTSG